MTDDELLERLRQYSKPGRGDDHPQAVACREAKNRIEALTAERDKAYASGYSDAETEISKSALGQRVAFLNAEYANAAACIKRLTAERDARIDPALVQDMIKAAEPVLAAAYLSEYIRANDAEAERDRWIEHTKNAVWADSAELKQALAENERLREALEQIAGVKGPFGIPFPEATEGYGSFAIVTARAVLESSDDPAE